MKGLILAAGRGSRMKGLTDERPKCLTKIAGKTLLSWQISSLNRAGINDVAVVRGYKYEMLDPEVLHIASGSFSVVNNDRWAETNMVSSLFSAKIAVNYEDVIVSYSDIVYKSGHVGKLMASEYDIAITYDEKWLDLWSLRFEDPLSDAETFLQVDGRLKEIGNKPKTYDEIHGQYMGLIKLTSEGWRLIEKEYEGLEGQGDKIDVTSFLKLLLKKGVTIGAVPISGAWCEVDSEQDLLKYESKLGDPMWSHNWIDW